MRYYLYGKTLNTVRTSVPWAREVLLPKGTQVKVIEATNQPEDNESPKWWVESDNKDDPWHDDCMGYGVLLRKGDIHIHGDRPLLLPQYTKFNELFDAWESKNSTRTLLPQVWDEVNYKNEAYTVPIGPNFRISGNNTPFTYGHVRCSDEVADIIKSNMLPIERDTITFELIFRDDGVLVKACNGLILASRYLALIEPDSVPTTLLAKE